MSISCMDLSCSCFVGGKCKNAVVIDGDYLMKENHRLREENEATLKREREAIADCMRLQAQLSDSQAREAALVGAVEQIRIYADNEEVEMVCKDVISSASPRAKAKPEES